MSARTYVPTVRLGILAAILWSPVSSAQKGPAGIVTPEHQASERKQRWAVLIGVNQYEDEQGIGSLKYCVDDMKLLYGVLTAANGGFQPGNVLLMTDDASERMHRPTYSNMVTMIPRWLKDVGPEDDVLIAFSGHGMAEDGKCYLLPGTATRGALRLTSVSVAQVREWLESCRAKRKILILDACHSGAGKAPGQMSEEMMADIERGHGFVILASCDTKQKSSEDEKLGHGVFTHYLAQALQGQGDLDGDGRVGADEAYRYVSREVQQWARLKGLEQDPVLSGRWVGGPPTLAYAPPRAKREEDQKGGTQLVDLLLRIEPGDAVVKVDGKAAQLRERGTLAFVRIMPGSHVLEVSKEGYSRLEKVIDVSVYGAEGTVKLARMETHATVTMKSGRKYTGKVVSRTTDKITIDRGDGKGRMTFTQGMYEKVELREVPSGESTVEVYTKSSGAVAGAISQGLISPLPEGTLAEQVREFLKRWEANRESLEKARKLYGEKALEVLRLEQQRGALSHQAGELAAGIKAEMVKAEELRDGLIEQGRVKENPVVRGVDDEVQSRRNLLNSLGHCVPRHVGERLFGRLGIVPPGLDTAFIVPVALNDQYGNPVVTRNGSRCDPETGCANEIWLKQTRMEFVFIPAGEFLMGSALSPEEAARKYGGEADWHEGQRPQHRVRISKPFYMSKYEVTQGQWDAVMGSSPWSGKSGVQDDARNPAVCVSWDDCQQFAKKLGLRLPTEAEWEYACRAGSSSAYCFGDALRQAKEYGWYHENALDIGEPYAHAAGRKRPNAWGLYDMHGNVWEWCQDWYGEYASASLTDPTGPPRGSDRVCRGGSFLNVAGYCRSACRFWLDPDGRGYYFGFRPSMPLR